MRHSVREYQNISFRRSRSQQQQPVDPLEIHNLILKYLILHRARLIQNSSAEYYCVRWNVSRNFVQFTCSWVKKQQQISLCVKFAIQINDKKFHFVSREREKLHQKFLLFLLFFALALLFSFFCK